MHFHPDTAVTFSANELLLGGFFYARQYRPMDLFSRPADIPCKRKKVFRFLRFVLKKFWQMNYNESKTDEALIIISLKKKKI